MNFKYIDLNNQKDLIDGVLMRQLIVHRDATGTLVETLRSDWQDVAGSGFSMQYLSVTPPGVARDEDQWHVHQHQEDRFVCISGRIVTAIFDPRQNSKTQNKLNLFLMGPDNEHEMYLLVIPRATYHAFMVVSKTPGYLLNFPTQLYNPKDEGRVKNTKLDWQKVRQDFNLS